GACPQARHGAYRHGDRIAGGSRGGPSRGAEPAMSRAIVPGRRRLVRAAALPLAHRAGLAPVAAAPFAPLPAASVPLAAVLAGADGALVPAALAATPACVDPSEPRP